jgi:hypothetical protein
MIGGAKMWATAELTMRAFRLFLLLLLTTNIASSQIQFDQAIAISKSDPIYPALEARQLEIQKHYAANDYAVVTFTPWIRVDAPAAAKLFPNLRFASIAWSESVNPKVKPLPAHDLGFGIELTVAVDTRSLRIVNEQSDSGDDPQFSQLLAGAKVQIVTESDAKMVWDAFCSLTHHHWENYPAVKVSDVVWHLGISGDGKFDYYYEILLDRNHFVQSGKLSVLQIK